MYIGTMNKERAFGYCLGWTKNKLKTLAFPNSSNGAIWNRYIMDHDVVSPSFLRNYSAATSLYKNMCIEGIPASRCTLNMLMNCFCLEGRVDYGFSLLGTFFKRGVAPDATTFNTLLRGLFQEFMISDATELAYKIGKLYRPNAVMTYIVSDAMFHIEMGYDLEEHLTGDGCNESDNELDFSIYFYIYSLVTEKRIDEIPGFIRDMSKDGIERTYYTLISLFGDEGNWNEVKRWWNEMLSLGIQPSLITYQLLIDILCEHGLIEGWTHVSDSMVRRASTITYDRLIDICHVEGQENEARRIIDTVAVDGVVPGISTLNFILQELLHSGRCKMARDFFSELQLGSLKANFDTYCVMLDGLCKNGFDNEALELLAKVEKEGVELPMTMHSMILDELRKRDAFSSGSLETLPNWFMTGIISLCKHGLLEEAKVIFAEGEGAMGYPTQNMYLEGLLEGEKYNDAMAYIDEMVAREFGLNSTSQVLEFISKKENNKVTPQNVKATEETSTSSTREPSSTPSFEDQEAYYEAELMVT